MFAYKTTQFFSASLFYAVTDAAGPHTVGGRVKQQAEECEIMKNVKQIGKTMIGALFALITMLVTTVSVSAAPLMENASLGSFTGWAFVGICILIGIVLMVIPPILKIKENRVKAISFILGIGFLGLGVFSTVDLGFISNNDATASIVGTDDVTWDIKCTSTTGTDITVNKDAHTISTMVVCNATDDSVRPKNETAMNVTEPVFTFSVSPVLKSDNKLVDETQGAQFSFAATDPGKTVRDSDGDTYYLLDYDSDDIAYLNWTFDGSTERPDGTGVVTIGDKENITLDIEYSFAGLSSSDEGKTYNIPFTIAGESWTFSIFVITQMA
jgi:hypothetical protein